MHPEEIKFEVEYVEKYGFMYSKIQTTTKIQSEDEATRSSSHRDDDYCKSNQDNTGTMSRVLTVIIIRDKRRRVVEISTKYR